MRSIPVLFAGFFVLFCLLAPVGPLLAEPSGGGGGGVETKRERRDRLANERQAAKLAELAKPIRKVQSLIDQGKRKEAFGGAREIRRRLGEPKQLAVEVLFVRLALLEGKPQVALGLIEPFVVARDRYDPALFDAHYYHALARLELANEPTREQVRELADPGSGPAFFGVPLDRETDLPSLGADRQASIREVLVVFDWLAGQAKDLDQVYAASSAARALALLGDYPQSIQAYEFAIHRVRHGGLDEYFDSETDAKGRLLRELQAALNEVRRMQEIQRYSMEYFLYREGDRAQRHKGDLERAVEFYDAAILTAARNRQAALDGLIAERLPALEEGQKLTPREQVARARALAELTEELSPEVPVSPFSDASRLNRFKCLFGLGRGREALKELEAFIAEDELGLYRGEALMMVSTVAMDAMNLSVASRWLGKLDAWVVNARAESADWDFNELLPGIRAAAKKVTDAPREETKTDYWGNVKAQPIALGQLVNRKTCPWYLDDLEERGAKYLGFIQLARGDGEAALKQFRRIIALDPHASDGDLSTNPNDFTRLKFGCENGYLTTYPQDLEKLTEKQRMVMLYGDFLYVTQEFDRAIGVYQSVLDGRAGRLKPGREDCVYQAIGMVHLRQGARGKAIEYWEKSLAEPQGTWSEYRSAYAIALISRHGSDKALVKRGQRLLRALAESKADNQFTQQARITLAMDLAKAGQLDEAKELLGAFKERDGQLYALAQYLMKNDGRLVIPKAVKPEDREAGEENGRKWERIQIPGPPKKDKKDKRKRPEGGDTAPPDPPEQADPDQADQKDQAGPGGEEGQADPADEKKQPSGPDFFGIPTD